MKIISNIIIRTTVLLAFPILLIGCGRNPENKVSGPEPDFSPSTSTHIRTDINVAQGILNLTGEMRVKLVWLQARLIDEDTSNYVPNYRDFLFNAPASQLIVFDTDEGEGRILDSTPSPRGVPLISRDGSKVFWSDLGKKRLYMMNWDGTGKKVLLEGNIFHILCVQLNEQTNTEWVYVSDLWQCPVRGLPTGVAIYRYALRGMELDTANREMVSQSGFIAPWTVSSDGKYGGGEYTWPNVGVQTLPMGQFYPVCDTGANCCAELAPDTSYLFFFFHYSHWDLTIYKFTPTAVIYISTTNINIDGTGFWECCCPRWTNRVQYLTGGYPYQAGWFYSAAWGGRPPSDPKSIQPGATGEFCFGKFTTDYTHIDWIRITDMDIRFRKVCGDGWVGN